MSDAVIEFDPLSEDVTEYAPKIFFGPVVLPDFTGEEVSDVQPVVHELVHESLPGDLIW